MFSKIPAVYVGRKVRYININSIRPSVTRNPEELLSLKEDILKNGMINPLIIQDESCMICLTGNQRLAVLKSLNVNEVPVIFLCPLLSISKKNVNIKKNTYYRQILNSNYISGRERIRRKKNKKIKNKK